MAHHEAEKLMIVGDFGVGLLNRVSNLITFKSKGQLLEVELSKFSKLLVKKFPENTEALDKDAALFDSRSSEIVEDLREYYATFKDVLQFTEEAWKLLTDLATQVLEFKFELNADLMTHYFNLFTNYCKLHILIGRVESRKLVLSAYARAYHMVEGNTEPMYNRVTTYIEEFARPIRTIQESSGPLTECVGSAILGLMPMCMKYMDSKMLIQKDLFNVMDTPQDILIPKEKMHLEVLHMNRIKEWVLYSYLCVPAALAQTGALNLLTMALKTTFIVPIFRQHVLDVHEELDTLFGWFKTPEKKNPFKLTKHRKILKEIWLQHEATLESHRELRVYLRLEMEILLRFFSEYPHCLAPKIQLVYCIMELSRSEVLWYFRHLDVLPYRQKTGKYTFPRDLDISHLIYLVRRLQTLIEAHSMTIREYYLKYMNTSDREVVSPVAAALMNSGKLDNNQISMVESIMEHLSAGSVDVNFEAIRLNWYRISAVCSLAGGVPPKTSQDLCQAMNHVMPHTRNVDSIPLFLKTYASFHELYWYSSALKDLLKNSLHGKNGQQKNCIAIVQVLSMSLFNVHRMSPEDLKTIGTRAYELGDELLRTIGMEMEKITRLIYKLTRVLTNQYSVHAALTSLSTKKNKATKPGYESTYSHRNSTEQLRTYRRQVAGIAAAIGQVDTIPIYNVQFVPREYLQEIMAANVREILRQKIWHLDPRGKRDRLNRPSQILSDFRRAIYVYQTVERHLNINLSDIVRSVLLSEFAEEGTGGPGDPLYNTTETKSESKEESWKPSIRHMTSWYVSVFGENLGEKGVFYSPNARAFVATPFVQVKGQQPVIWLDAASFTDYNELKALCTLVGPGGVRALNRGLLAHISKLVKRIKEILAKNMNVLTDMVNRFAEFAHWSTSVGKLVHMDEFVNLCITIGNILTFRKLMTKALRDVCEDAVPFVVKATKMGLSQAHADPGMFHNVAGLDRLGRDCGLDDEEADHNLITMFADFKSSGQDLQLWTLLPEAFAAMLSAKQWRKSTYVVEHEGHSNNAHCAAETIRSFMISVNSTRGRVASNVEARIQDAFERFLHSASFSLLHMAQTQRKLSGEHGALLIDSPFPHSTIFLEMFVSQSNRLDLNALETCMPHTIIRTNYIHLYHKQAANVSKTAVEAQEERERAEEEKKVDEVATTRKLRAGTGAAHARKFSRANNRKSLC